MKRNRNDIEGRSSAPCSASFGTMQDAYLRIISANAVCRDGRIGVIRDHIVYDKNRDEICACENDHQAEKVAAAFNALAYIATLKTDQLASSAQCSAVAVAMDVLSLPNACRLAHADEKLTDQKETP